MLQPQPIAGVLESELRGRTLPIAGELESSKHVLASLTGRPQSIAGGPLELD